MSQWQHSQLHSQPRLRTIGCRQAKTHDFLHLVLAVQGKMLLHSNKWDLKIYLIIKFIIKFIYRVHSVPLEEGDHLHLPQEEDLHQQFQIDQVA